MFGYIQPEKPELKIKEYELFRAYYCGVCKSIGKRFGQIKRLALTYDSAFLAILLSAVDGGVPEIKKERCIAHQINRRHVVKNNSIVDYSADINILLAYYNLEDKNFDKDSAVYGPAVLFFKRAAGKVKAKYPEKCREIESRLAELRRLEKEMCPSMDRAAEPFAKLMEEVMVYPPLCKDANNEKILRWIGYNLGKWVYIIDAYNDLTEDIKKKNYNPLLYQFGYGGEELENFKDRIRERVEFNLTHSLSQVSKAYELIKIKSNKGILENIIYLGLLRKTENIIGTGSCKDIGKSV
jgi:hypothetical protein